MLGRGLALLPRDQIVVATKVGRYGSGFDFRWGPLPPPCSMGLLYVSSLMPILLAYTHYFTHILFGYPASASLRCQPARLQRRACDRQRARVAGPPAAHLRGPHPMPRHRVYPAGPGGVGQLHRPKAPAQCHWCLAGSTACCLQRSLPVLPELLDHWLLLLPACMPACPPSCPLPAALLCPALQIVNETLPALQRLKEEGLVRHIGITGLPLKVYRYVLDRCGGALDLARAGPDMTSHL